MEKHIYKIIINGPHSGTKKYTYNFGRTKSIDIFVAKGFICIKAKLNKIYDKREILSKDAYLFPDALKKALLIHLVLYSEQIEIKNVVVQIDEEIECIIDTSVDHAPLFYSMVTGRLLRPFCTEWTDDSINGILYQKKSSCDSRIAALFAFICSKCKQYESERFLYLWMAFNGMYNYFAGLINDYGNHNKKKGLQENLKLQYIQRLFSLGDEMVVKADKKRIAQGVSDLIKNRVQPISRSYLESDEGQSFGDKIQPLLTKKNGQLYKISPYGYLLIQFSYYYRCNLFHADKPLALFCYAEENDICCLRTINSLLEEFIDQNLSLWFSEQYVAEHLRREASLIAN